MWGCCVTSIQITTNHNVYELLGDHNNVLDVFVFRPDGRTIIGFHGYSGFETIKAIGVYVKDEVKHLREQLAEEARLRLQVQEDFRKMCNENKALKRMAKEHDKFRNWIEHAKSSDSSVDRFENFKLPPYDSVEDCLGGGAYGNVYKAEMKTAFAIKIRRNGNWQGDRQFDQEIEILRNIRHPNLVSLIGACKKNYALVYEYLPNGNLQQLLAKSKQRGEGLSWSERTKIAASICSTLVFLHQTEPNPIAHGDLKPENILFDSNNVCKLCDFGISRYLENVTENGTPNHETERCKGTYGYMDPEYVKTRKLTPLSDVYAFGIILLQLVTGEDDCDGLRDNVLGKIESLEKFIKQSQLKQRMILGQFPNPNLRDCSINEAVKMTCLGIRCSEPLKKNRPDLEKDVWVEIVNGFASVNI